MSLHIFRARDQRATRYIDDVMGVNHYVTNPANRLFWAYCCDKRRPAKNLTVHVYYDGTYYFCAAGTGCKDPAFIAAKRRREFRNRSVGNRAAWARRKAAAQRCESSQSTKEK